MSSSDDSEELRGRAPKTIVDVLDAVSTHRRLSRWQLVLEVLTQWADDRQCEAIAIARVTGCMREDGR